MSKFFKKALIGSLSVTLLGLALGCGSTSNNDQGVSVQNLGYFVVGSTEDPPPGITGAIIPLSADVALDAEVNDFFPTQGTGLVDGLTHFASMGVFNRMQNQFIRIVRIDCHYEIPGASPDLVIPTDSENVSFIVNASVYTPDNPLGDVVSSDTAAFPNIVYAPFQLLSPDLYAFLNANRAKLPELPFRMTATCSATGVTQAGDNIETNEMPYQIQFVDFSECCTGDTSFVPGFQIGSGTGGDTSGSVVTGSSGSTGAQTTGSDTSGTGTASDAGTGA